MNTPNPKLMRQYGTESVFMAKTAGEASSLLAQLSMGILNFKMEEDRQKSVDQTRLEDEARAEIVQAKERHRMHAATEHLMHTQAPLLISAAGSRGGRGEFSSEQVPVGMDEGMVRLASIMVGVGEDMAKEALDAYRQPGMPAVPMHAFNGVPSHLVSHAAQTANYTGAGKATAAVATAAAKAAPKAPIGLLQHAKNFIGAPNMTAGGGLGWKGNLLAIGATAGAGLLASKALNAGSKYMQQDSRGPANYGPQGGYQLPMGVSPQGQPQL